MIVFIESLNRLHLVQWVSNFSSHQKTRFCEALHNSHGECWWQPNFSRMFFCRVKFQSLGTCRSCMGLIPRNELDEEPIRNPVRTGLPLRQSICGMSRCPSETTPFFFNSPSTTPQQTVRQFCIGSYYYFTHFQAVDQDYSLGIPKNSSHHLPSWQNSLHFGVLSPLVDCRCSDSSV